MFYLVGKHILKGFFIHFYLLERESNGEERENKKEVIFHPFVTLLIPAAARIRPGKWTTSGSPTWWQMPPSPNHHSMAPKTLMNRICAGSKDGNRTRLSNMKSEGSM